MTMATIKAYTDISQSKTLSKILPLESADMFYIAGKGEPIFIGNKMVACGQDDYDCLGGPDVLCWSLASLLSAIPYNVSFNKAVYRFELVKYSNHWECYHENFGSVSTEIFKADNPLDACVAMIERLHELNLL